MAETAPIEQQEVGEGLVFGDIRPGDAVEQIDDNAPISDQPDPLEPPAKAPSPAALVKEEVKEEKPAEDPVAEDGPDPLDAYIKGDTKEPVKWDEQYLSMIETEFGAKSPEELKSKLAVLEEKAEVGAKAKQDSEDLQKTIDALPFELRQAITRQLQGEDGVAYLRGLPTGATLAKAAKDIDSNSLVDTYYPGKFTEEEKEAIEDGGHPLLQAAHDRYAELAGLQHDGLRKESQDRSEKFNTEQTKYKEAVDASRVSAVAFLKTDPALSALVDNNTIQKFRSGQLESELLYNQDGTYRPEALARLAKILVHDKVVERARAGAHTQGKNEGILETSSRQPNKPIARPAGRAAQAPELVDQERTKKEQVESSIIGAL